VIQFRDNEAPQPAILIRGFNYDLYTALIDENHPHAQNALEADHLRHQCGRRLMHYRRGAAHLAPLETPVRGHEDRGGQSSETI
jgi:hypothetical protein